MAAPNKPDAAATGNLHDNAAAIQEPSLETDQKQPEETREIHENPKKPQEARVPEEAGASALPRPTEPSEPSEPAGLSNTQSSANAGAEEETLAKKLERRLKEQAENTPTERKMRDESAGPASGGPENTKSTARPGASASATAAREVDDFGLPIRPAEVIQYEPAAEPQEPSENLEKPQEEKPKPRKWSIGRRSTSQSDNHHRSRTNSRESATSQRRASLRGSVDHGVGNSSENLATTETVVTIGERSGDTIEEEPRTPMPPKETASTEDKSQKRYTMDFATEHARESRASEDAGHPNQLSEFSHQQLTAEKKEEETSEDDGWQTMPAFAPYDIYDDDNRLIAREHNEEEDDKYGYAGLGGAGNGYTRVLVDDDAESATSMDDNTQYLFKTAGTTSMMEDEEEQRDTVSQMEATKDLLTEGQRIAYVGVTRLHLANMLKHVESLQKASRRPRSGLRIAGESMRMWTQKMMVRLYSHMDITLAEQVMIEQLSEHGVEPKDLTPALMANARVSNPMADDKSGRNSVSSPTTSHSVASPLASPLTSPKSPSPVREDVAEPPPPYEEHAGQETKAVSTPSEMPTTAKIDIDLRWTVLCDLFLVLVADSVYDARSRALLELVGESMNVSWVDICKFEKKVTEALEMQQNAERENWDEKDHMEHRRKMALKRRYVMMGLATVGGGLVIGLSAGLLAPVIGAGLAAGFTTIGVTGTSSFLAGAGGAALITSSAAASGSVIGVRAADRRTGAVKTFEYRPLHNNKRVNLIVTVSGWMTGKVDDVRLPFSTVNPIMGDIYSVLWEPEMLTSMGDTINILATEALTQGLQQVLGSTILVSLMAALQLPVILTKLAYLIDNPWAVSLDRATMAGQILADSLVDRNLGTRPVTLVGYSLGSRVIFSCLQELARKGGFGLVQNVFMFGSPVVVKQDEYLRARSVVAGRFVNGYNSNDWILGYLFRLTNGGIRRVAGLGPIDVVPDIENMDVAEFVVGHMDYRTAMPRLLRECGWMVESDEFTEIEDPDPEDHAQRQRELINEIEEARKELERESKTKKGGAFSFFTRRKKEKQEWEIYDEASKRARGGGSGAKTETTESADSGVLFDVDAIRAELARENSGKNVGELELEQLQVRELESTLPPMKLDVKAVSNQDLSLPAPAPARSLMRSPRGSFVERSASESVLPRLSSHEARSSSASFDQYGQLGDWTQRPTTRGTTLSFASGERSPGRHVVTDTEGISMTFDSSFDDSPAVMQKPAAPSETTTRATTPSAAAVQSPTVPAITLSDPWADDEDEDFGKEQEISMTFA